MIKKCLVILVLLLTCTSTYALEDEEVVVYNVAQSLVESGYTVKYTNLEGGPDGHDELWVVAIKQIAERYFTKMYVYTVLDDQYPLLWQSEDIKGYFVQTEPFYQNEQMYIWIEVILSEPKKYEMWVYRWNGAKTQKLNPLNSGQNEVSADGGFDCWDIEKDGELDFVARPDNNNLRAIYVLRNDQMVLKEKRLAVPHVIIEQKPVSEQYPEVAKLLNQKYSSYKLTEVTTIDHKNHIEICKLENKNNSREQKLVVLQADEKVKNIWYELPKEYAEYLLRNGVDSKDYNHDGSMEVLFLDAFLCEPPGIYILSIQPEGAKVVSPVDDNGVTLIYFTDTYDFEDYNKDGYCDMMLYTDSGETYLYWNEATQKLEFE